MKKLTAITVSEDTDKLIGRLLRLSCVEVTELLPEQLDGSLRPKDSSERRVRLERDVGRFETALKLLRPLREKRMSLFGSFQNISFDSVEEDDGRVAPAFETVTESERVTARLSEIRAERTSLASAIDTLTPWISCETPLSLTGTRDTQLMYGSIPASVSADEVMAKVSETVPCFAWESVSCDVFANYIRILYHNDDDADLPAALALNGFTRTELSSFTRDAASEIAAARERDDELAAETEELGDRLKALSGETDMLEAVCDTLRTRAAAEAAKCKLLCSESAVVLTGWVPARAVKAVGAALDGFDCCYSFEEPAEGDDIPVMLINNRNLEPFEMVMGLYSLPAYGTFDPTFIMSVFYFVIFGFMLADVVYGLLLTVGGFLVLRFARLGDGAKRLIKLFAICGVSCIVAGILFGSYLGDFPVVFMREMIGVEIPDPSIWFNPVEDPVSFLIVSLAVGALHLLVGMGIKFYVLCVTGHPFAAIFDVGGWYVLFAGVGLYFVNATVGIAVAVTGALMLIVSQGRDKKNPIMRLISGVGSLYGIVNYIADMLSYSRIMALGMASAVIASVVNIIATLMGPMYGLGYIFMLVIVVIGNVINIAINLLGSFVHTSRLQYIEFFGKFFEDGGRAFTPLCPDTVYTKMSAEAPAQPAVGGSEEK